MLKHEEPSLLRSYKGVHPSFGPTTEYFCKIVVIICDL